MDIEKVDEKHLRDGYKADEEKTRWDLLPYESLEEIARVYTFGARKYDDHNWRKGMRYGRIVAAIQRHLSAFMQGQDRDPETNLLHAAHAAFGCLALVSYLLTGTGTDDRYKIQLVPVREPDRTTRGVTCDELFADPNVSTVMEKLEKAAQGPTMMERLEKAAKS